MRAILQQPLRSFWPSLCLMAFAVLPACAQAPASQSPAESQAELGANIEAKIDALTHSIEQMQSQLQQSQAEIQQLREMLGEVLRAQGAQGTYECCYCRRRRTCLSPRQSASSRRERASCADQRKTIGKS